MLPTGRSDNKNSVTGQEPKSSSYEQQTSTSHQVNQDHLLEASKKSLEHSPAGRDNNGLRKISLQGSQKRVAESYYNSKDKDGQSLLDDSKEVSSSDELQLNQIESSSAISFPHSTIDQNKENPYDENHSTNPIKGDSISVTIANLSEGKQNDVEANSGDRPSSGASIPFDNDRTASQQQIDDSASKLNYYPVYGSTSGSIVQQDSQSQSTGNNRQVDFVSLSSAANIDAFEIIEENSSISSDEAVLSQPISQNSVSSERALDVDSDYLPNRRANQARARSKYQNKTDAKHGTKRRSRPITTLEQALCIYDMPPDASSYQIEPVTLRGNGNLTLFGLSNSFSSDFPSSLIGRVSKEEFDKTMRRINTMLKDQQSLSAKLLLFGGLCCCCSFGFSLIWPSIALKRRSKLSLEKFLAAENGRLYSKLGLSWKLAEQRCYSNPAFVEYVLMIEFAPKTNLYLPD